MTYLTRLSSPDPLLTRSHIGALALVLVPLAAFVLAPYLPAWLDAWPREKTIPAAEKLTEWIGWIANAHILENLTVKDATRSFSALLGLPTALFEALLVDGFNRGFGLQKVNLVPPLSWFGVAGALLLTAWRLGSIRLVLLTAVTSAYLLLFGLWHSAMQTLSMLAVAVPLGAGLGLGLGIVLWRRRSIQDPMLLAFDQLQTIPIFAYLTPIVAFFGLGNSPAILATVIFAVPTMIRTTVEGLNLAQRSVGDLPSALGCNHRQELWKVLIPTAQAELHVGINQIVMLSFSCTVLASLIGTNGLGKDVLVALRMLDIGRGLEAGLAITLMAILLDQFFQSSVSRAEKRRMNLPGFLCALLAVLIIPTIASCFMPQLTKFPETWTLSTGAFADRIVEEITVNLFWLTEGIKNGLLIHVLLPFKAFMADIPWSVGVFLTAFCGFLVGGWTRALQVGLLMQAIVVTGLWQLAMLTIYLCSIAVAAAFIIGTPIGILAGRKPAAARLILPIVDTLQTLPGFVYLIPVIMFFGAGDFPALVAITVFAICPAIRFAELGIRSVPVALTEVGKQVGMTSLQRLFKVEIPAAAPQLLLGLNATIIMGLSMLVVTALIGTKDLGRETLTALAKVDPGQGLVAGLAVACLSVISNRLIGKMAENRLAGRCGASSL